MAKQYNKKIQQVAKPQFEEITLKKGQIITIKKDMIIGDVVAAYPETRTVLEKNGIHCVSCYASPYETIEEGAQRHGIDPEKICKKLNAIIKKKQK